MTRKFLVALVLAVGGATPTAVAHDDGAITIAVMDADGRPSDGARVLVSLQPVGMVERGTRFPARLAGVTDANGIVVLPQPITRAERAIADRNDGWVNYAATALGGDGRVLSVTGFSRYVGDDPSQTARTTNASGRVVRLTPQAGRAGIGPSVGTWCVNWDWEVMATDRRPVVVGELHTQADTSASFTYGRTADSDIDIGWHDGAGWYVSGSVHSGTTRTSSVTKNVGIYFENQITTDFRFAKLGLYADCLEGHLFQGHMQAVATSWRGGIMNGQWVGYNDGQRNEYDVAFGMDTEFDREDGDFTKWTGAVGVFGASLGAQSGASSSVRIHYAFGTGRGIHWLYGDDADPPDAHRIFASDT
jgi:hypothetical protein